MSTRTIIPFTTEEAWLAERAKDVTSTESSALFGMNPRLTLLELYYRKVNGVPSMPENERIGWGKRLQDVIAQRVGEVEEWRVRPMTDYVRIDDSGMGSSFDYSYSPLELFTYGYGILEVKNVDFLIWKQQWIDGEAPEHIEIQLQHQLHVAHMDHGAIAVLVGGNQLHVLKRERDREVGAAIEARIKLFWQMVENRTPPPAVYPDDAETVARLYGYADPGKVLDARQDENLKALAAQYAEAQAREKAAKEDKDTAKARLLEAIKDAEKVLLDGYTISAGLVGPAEVKYHREGYRNFRVSKRGQ